jgi:hypothetical protein
VIIIALLALILCALLFPNAMRALVGILLAMLCFSIAVGLGPDGASRDNDKTEQVRR